MASKETFHKKYGNSYTSSKRPVKKATKPSKESFHEMFGNSSANVNEYQKRKKEEEKKETVDKKVSGLTQSITKESLYNPDEAFEPYRDYLNRLDYKEKSQYSSSAKREGFWKTIGMDGSDETYEFINDVDGARERLVAKYKEGNGATELEQHGYQYMTDEEKGVYNYKYAVEGKESADKYLKDLEISLNKRVYDKSTETWEKWADDSAVKSTAMSLVSPITSMAGGIGSAFETAREKITGDEYNPYAPLRVASNATSDIRGYVGENIAESTEGMEVFGGNPFQQAYGALMSGADSFLMANALGPLGLKKAISPIMAMNSYQQTAKEQTEAGEDPDTVQAMAVTVGAIEYITEKIGIDNFFKLKNPDSITSLLKNMRNQAGSEAFEEALSELGITIAEDVIKGEDSKLYSKYNDLIARGYSKKEALFESAKEFGANMFWAAIGGALSGGVLGGIDGSIRHNDLKKKGAEIRSNDRVSEMMDVAGDAFMSLSEKDAHNLYTEYAKSGVTAENITDVQLGNLYSSVAQNIDDVTLSKKATPQEQNDIRRQIEGLETVNKAKTTKMADTGKAVNIEGVKSVDGERVLQTSEGEVKAKDVKLSHTDAELMSYAEGMDDSKANLMLSQYDGKSDVEAYVNSFEMAYAYGETGFGTDYVLKNKGTLTERQALNVYKEATMARARKNSEAFVNAVDKTITREMLDGRFDDSIIDYDGSGKGTVKWNMLTSSEKMNINAAKVIAGAMKNTRFEFIESRVENGEYKGENARWDPTTRTISIDVHAGRNKLTDENSYIMSAMSHEITHSFERTAAEEYANLRDHVMNYLANRDGIDASELIARKRMQIGDSHAKRGIELTDERVINEIVADACEEMLVNSKKVDEYLKGMDENTKKSFIGKVKETFENIIKAINDVIKKLDPRTKEARALRESKEDFEKALELWDKAFAKENESHAESISTDTEINNALNEIGLEYDSETETVFSLRSLEEALNYNYSEHYHYDNDDVVVIDTKMFSKSKVKNNYKEVNSLVKDMLHELVGKRVEIRSDKRIVLFDAKTAKEYTGSVSTYSASVDEKTTKSNMAIALEKIVERANNPKWIENKKPKHNTDAGRGWTYYDLLFGIRDNDENIYYSARLVVRMDVNGKDYVYDVDHITKKEARHSENFSDARPASNNSLPFSDNNVKYSDRYDDVWFDLFDEDGSMAASSAIIDEDVERLRERLSMGASSMSDANIQMIAKHLRKIADSSYDNDELMDELKDIYGYIEHHDYFDGNALVSKCNDVARRILSEQREHKVTNDYAKMVLKDIRATKIKLNAEQIAEAKNRYGEKYRNALFGRITISNEGISLDSKWQEWSGQYPSIFSADVNSADMINELADIYDSLREASETGQRFAEVNDVRALGAEIYNQYWIRSTVQTESEKNQQKVKELNLKHRNAMKKLREDYQKRLENQRLADSMHYGKIINEIRQRNKDEVKKAKALGKKRMEDYRENIRKNEMIKRITKKAMKLSELLTTNSKEKHVVEPMKKIVGNFLLSIDFSSKQFLGMNGEKTKGHYTKNDLRFDRELEKILDMMESSNRAVSSGDTNSTYYGAVFSESLVDVVRDMVKNINNIKDIDHLSGYTGPFVLNKMSVEDLKVLSTLIDVLKKTVAQADMLIASESKERISELATQDMKYHDGLGSTNTYDGAIGALHRGAAWRNTLPKFAFKRFGRGAQKIFEGLMNGWDKLAFHAKQIIEFTDDLYTVKEINEWKKQTHEFTLANGRKIRMTVPQIMSLYCLSQREQARLHMYHEEGYSGAGIRIGDFKDGTKVVKQTKGTPITMKEVSIITSKLTKRQIDVANQLQTFMQTVCAEWGNETTMKLYGIMMMSEEYYFPIKTDSNDRPNEPEEKEKSIFRLINMSFTKPINPNAKNVIVVEDIFDVFAKHSSEMAKYNALAAPIYDAFRWYSYKGEINGEKISMKSSLEHAFGNGGKNYVYTFLQDLNGVEKNGRVELVRTFFKNAKIASVGANFRVAVLQPTAYVRAGLVIDGKYLMKAFAHKPKVGYSKKYCGIALWKSLGYYDTNIQKGLADQIKHNQTKKEWLVEKSMALAGKMDEYTWGYLWNACELEIRDKRRDLKVGSEEFFRVVGERLREIVYSTQVVDSTMTRSESMRSGDGMDLATTAFMSEPTVTYNILADALSEWNLTYRQTGSKEEAFKKNGKHLVQTFKVYTATAIVTSLAEAMFDVYRDTEEDEEKKVKYWEAFLQNLMDNTNPLGLLPYVKEIAFLPIIGFRILYKKLGLPQDTTFAKSLEKYEVFGSSNMETQWIDYFINAASSFEKLLSGNTKVSTYTFVKNLFKMYSSMRGMPLFNAWREVTSATNKTGIWSASEIEEFFDETVGEFLRSE